MRWLSLAARMEVAMDEGVSQREGLRPCSSDLNRCICRSRRRVGRCEFSARFARMARADLRSSFCDWAAELTDAPNHVALNMR